MQTGQFLLVTDTQKQVRRKVFKKSSRPRAGPSITTLWTPHMPIFQLKLNSAQNRATKLKELGPISPVRALATETEAQYIQVSAYNILVSRMPVDRGHWAGWNPIWDQIRLPGAVRGRPGPQKGPSGLKWALLGALGVS